MKNKICMGCFCQWDDEWEICPICGFSGEEKGEEARQNNMYKGKRGDIYEKRFLMGKLFYERKHLEVWRAYDGDLEQKVFLYMAENKYARAILILADMIMYDNKDTGQKVLGMEKYEEYTILKVAYCSEEKAEQSLEYLIHAKEEKKWKHSVISEMDIRYTNSCALKKDVFLNEHYRIIGPLGMGGFGITYLCEDIHLGRNVAIKEYFPREWVTREEKAVTVRSSTFLEPFLFGKDSFKKEVKMTAKFIFEKGIVSAYDYFEENDTAYLVMEYISGKSLGKVIKERDTPFSVEEMCDILEPLLDSIESIHDYKIVHSDISPGNIMVTDEKEYVLIDLGAAKYWHDTSPNLSATFLKPDFAAPEQYRTAKTGIPKDEGPWTDIYGIGAVMYYLLTGHKPKDVITRLESQNPKLVPPRKYRIRIKKNYMKVIDKCMDVDRKKRYQSIQEIRKIFFREK